MLGITETMHPVFYALETQSNQPKVMLKTAPSITHAMELLGFQMMDTLLVVNCVKVVLEYQG